MPQNLQGSKAHRETGVRSRVIAARGCSLARSHRCGRLRYRRGAADLAHLCWSD